MSSNEMTEQFHIRLTPGEEGRFRAYRVGNQYETFDLPFSAEQFEDVMVRSGLTREVTRGDGVRDFVRVNHLAEEQAVSAFDEIKRMGGELFESIMVGDNYLAYHDAVRAHESYRQLQIRIHVDADGLQHLPWEWMFNHRADEGRGQFLELDPRLTVLRAGSDRVALKTVKEPLRVLVVTSQVASQPLAIEREVALLEAAFAEEGVVGRIEAEVLRQVSVSRLVRVLNEARVQGRPFHALHYIGHGTFHKERGWLLFQEESGNVEQVAEVAQGLPKRSAESDHVLVDGTTLRTILQQHSELQFVFLNACKGASNSNIDPFAGVAQQVSGVVPAVIAMQAAIKDDKAIALSAAFYRYLAQSGAVDTALGEARVEVGPGGDNLEWATPVLFLSSENSQLLRPPGRGWWIEPRWVQTVVGIVAVLVMLGGWFGRSLGNSPVVEETGVADLPAAVENVVEDVVETVIGEGFSADFCTAEGFDFGANHCDQPTTKFPPLTRRVYASMELPDDLEEVQVSRVWTAIDFASSTDPRTGLLTPKFTTKPYILYPGAWAVNFRVDDTVIFTGEFDIAHPIETEDPAEMVEQYWSLVDSGEFEAAWVHLTEPFQTQTNPNGLRQYVNAWRNLCPVEIGDAETVDESADSATVRLMLGFAYDDCTEFSRYDFTLTLQMSARHGVWQINEAQSERVVDETVTDRVASDGMHQVLIPSGTFLMGSSDEVAETARKQACLIDPEGPLCVAEIFSAETPQHRVTLDAYWIDRTEVTNEMYRACVEAGECDAPALTYVDAQRMTINPGNYFLNVRFNEYPVVGVNWGHANAYCSWAGRQLPTEAQWERAARGDLDTRRFPMGEGDMLNCSVANFEGCVNNPTPIDRYEEDGASPFGVYDMAGNVWEWTNDWYDINYYRSSAALDNPAGANVSSENTKIIRGGSWYDPALEVRVSYRGRVPLEHVQDDVGFRCIESAD